MKICFPARKKGKVYTSVDDDVDVLHQYDLKELGFTALQEESTADMSKSLRNATGVAVLVQSQSVLHDIGASFGVHKLLSDPPHWSDDGH